ncbi:hypothetical protein JCM19039_3544 [Geomicrobium sp. JCM 19039]|nr:hypothetical protein JCM19039_3544 [Geomicrobium sp. JCM 19039]
MLFFMNNELRAFLDSDVRKYAFILTFLLLGSLAMMNVRRNSREDKVLTKDDAIRSVGLLIALMLFMAFFNGMLW